MHSANKRTNTLFKKQQLLSNKKAAEAEPVQVRLLLL